MESSSIKSRKQYLQLINAIDTKLQISRMKKHSFFADTKLQVDQIKKKNGGKILKPLFI